MTTIKVKCIRDHKPWVKGKIYTAKVNPLPNGLDNYCVYPNKVGFSSWMFNSRAGSVFYFDKWFERLSIKLNMRLI